MDKKRNKKGGKDRQRKERRDQILEMDELYTYIKKNRIRSEYGLLWLRMRSALLHLKSEIAEEKR